MTRGIIEVMSSDRRSYDSTGHHLERPDSTTTDTTTTITPPPQLVYHHDNFYPLSNVQGAKTSFLHVWSVAVVACRADLFSCFRGSCLSSFCHGPSNCGTLTSALHNTTAWRGAIFCPVLMFPGILAPGLVPAGPGPGINHAFPDQAARVHRPRHYRGQ